LKVIFPDSFKSIALSIHKVFLTSLDLNLYIEPTTNVGPKKLLIFLKLELDYVLFSDLTEENNTFETTIASSDGTNKSKIVDEETRKNFDKDNKTVKRHLLNHMSNPLFDLFVTFKSVKIIWEKLEVKYGANDAGMKKYVVGE